MVQQRIRTLRQARGFTQEQLCERAKISVDAVTRIEGGTRVPTLETLESLAAALGTSVGELVASGKPAKVRKVPGPLAKLNALLEGEPAEVQEAVVDIARSFLKALRPMRS